MSNIITTSQIMGETLEALEFDDFEKLRKKCGEFPTPNYQQYLYFMFFSEDGGICFFIEDRGVTEKHYEVNRVVGLPYRRVYVRSWNGEREGRVCRVILGEAIFQIAWW